MNNLQTIITSCALLLALCACVPAKKDSAASTESSGSSGTSSPSPTPTPTPEATVNPDIETVTSATKTVTMNKYGVLFTTTQTFNGGFAWTQDGSNLAAADAACMTEATSRNLTGTFLAVSATNQRKIGTNWVLKASTNYRRADRTTAIGTTDATGALSFPLSNSIESSQRFYWTGLDTSTGLDFNTCSGWAFSHNMVSGAYGDSTATTNSAINAGASICSTTYSLLCAEKIKRTTTYSAQASYRTIFATSNTYTGGNGSEGTARFDAYCQAEANAKLLNTSDNRTAFKALVMTPSRLACLTADCANGPGEAVGWILEPNTEYRRIDGTVIGTTNANSIFTFPLLNSFTGVNELYWTGFPDTWAIVTNNSSNSCGFFQQGGSDWSSFVGKGNEIDSKSVYTTQSIACNNALKILCVEQKRAQNVYVDYPGY